MWRKRPTVDTEYIHLTGTGDLDKVFQEVYISEMLPLETCEVLTPEEIEDGIVLILAPLACETCGEEHETIDCEKVKVV